MPDKEENSSAADYDDPAHWPDEETAHKVMQKVLEHFQKHHHVVGKKLNHARLATIQSLQDMKAVYKELRLDQESKEFKEISKYDLLWDEIIKEFASSGVTEAELEQIEHILHTIPETIKRYYEALVMQDKILQNLIAELNAPEYLQAIEMTKKIQARRCPMSGLEPHHYDADADSGQKVTVYKNFFRKAAKPSARAWVFHL